MIPNSGPMAVLPPDFQTNWGAQLTPPDPHPVGQFHLVHIRRTKPGSFEDNRIVVLVLDENGIAMPSVNVAFAYSTAPRFIVTPDFTWVPPPPFRAEQHRTKGSGEIEQIQGGSVRDGQPGGVTVFILEPGYASAIVSGCGSLADHTGLHLTFRLQRHDVLPLVDRLANIEQRLAALE